MLDAMLRAAGLRTVAAGNMGLSLVDAVMDPVGFDVLAVELASSSSSTRDAVPAESVRAQPGPGPPRPVPATYASTPRQGADLPAPAVAPRLQRGGRGTEDWSGRPTSEGARAIGFTLGAPGVGMFGVVDDVLWTGRSWRTAQTSAAELAWCTTWRPATALRRQRARRCGTRPVPLRAPEAVREALRGFRPDGHRIARFSWPPSSTRTILRLKYGSKSSLFLTLLR